MAVITLDEVKVFLQISNESKDTLIEALIPVVESNIQEYCNDDFTTSGFPTGMKLVAAQMIGYDMMAMSGGGASLGMQSEDQGEYSYTRESGSGASGAVGEYPAAMLASLNKWRKTRIHFGSVMQTSRDRRALTTKQLASDKYLPGVEGELLNDDNVEGTAVI